MDFVGWSAKAVVVPTLVCVNGVAVMALLTLGLVVGVGISAAWRFGGKGPATPPVAPTAGTAEGVDMVAVLRTLSRASVVLDARDRPIHSTPGAQALGVIRGGRLLDAEIAEAAKSARRSGHRESLVLERVRGRSRMLLLNVQVTPIGGGQVLVLVGDMTHERRIDDVRRDFVANVSHELKTPIAALSLLGESVLAAADDRDAVERFTERMQLETARLSTLVNELIDLSRLEGEAPLAGARDLDLGEIVGEAVSRTRLSAAASSIELATSVQPGLHMYGDQEQIVSALANLIKNAVAYSPSGTRVAIAARRSGDQVEIGVTDQGIGISPRDLDRIFERFYRVDPARSRATGGTGLGLSIVKHVCANHEGEVDVWSVEGAGSTFTLRFPLSAPPDSSLEVKTGALAKGVG